MKKGYDDEQLFTSYAHMSRSIHGLEAAGEWHQMKKLFSDLKDKDVLDLGCGYGWHCQYAAQQGARKILGIDTSQKMLEVARQSHAHPRISYQQCSIEAYTYPEQAWDRVISNLAFHYMEDLDPIFASIYQTLREDGVLLFNMEHPVFTAGVRQEWIYDQKGKPLYWPVDDYFYPGRRQTRFLDQEVEKQHHTLSQIVMGVLSAGFVLDALVEAYPSKDSLSLPEMKDEMRRPMMLIIKAHKPRNDTNSREIGV